MLAGLVSFRHYILVWQGTVHHAWQQAGENPDQSKDISICILDAGMTADQIIKIKDKVYTVKKAEWDATNSVVTFFISKFPCTV